MKIAFLLVMLFLMGWTGFGHTTPIACSARANPPCLAGFPVEFSGGGIPADVGTVSYSSPAVARLGIRNDNYADIVVGTSGGYIVAYHADGSFLWAYKTGSVAIDSKPAIADIDGDGRPEIVVGAGDPNALGGGIYVLHNDGTLKCAFTAPDPTYSRKGMYSSPALAHLDRTRPNQMQIVVGSFDIHVRALNADCSVYWDKGYADKVVDTVWSSPAIYDLDGDGQLDVIIGQDSEAVTVAGDPLPAGGMVRAFRGNGVGELPGFPIKLNEVVYSSPAIGDITGTHQPSIVVGNGRYWDIAGAGSHPVTEEAYAWGAGGAAVTGWPYPVPLQSMRTASPALADLDGDGKLEAVINTLIKTSDPNTNDRYGKVHVIRSNGTAYPGWPVQPDIGCTTIVPYGTIASPIAVDLDGDGIAEIVLAEGFELVVWDRNGNQLSRKHTDACGTNPNLLAYELLTQYAVFSTPTAADLFGNGHISLVVGGASASGQTGALYAWQFPSSVAKPDNMPWPQFRANERNTGVYTPDRIFKNGLD